METICTQDIISSLLVLGYNQVDSIFITMVIGKASLDQQFEFIDKELDQEFENLIEYDGLIYKLKKGLSLETNISKEKDFPWTIRQYFSRKKNLIEYLEHIDIQKIVDKKVAIIGLDKLAEYRDAFSNKEKAFLPKIKEIKKKQKSR